MYFSKLNSSMLLEFLHDRFFLKYTFSEFSFFFFWSRYQYVLKAEEGSL